MQRTDFIVTTTETHFILPDRILGLVLGISFLLKIHLEGDLLSGNSSDLLLPIAFLWLLLNDCLNTSNAWPVLATG